MNVIKVLQNERRTLAQQIHAIDQAINLLSSRKVRHFSAGTRRKMALAQKRRWAKVLTMKKKAA